MPPDHMTSPPMRFENGLETQPPLPPHPPTLTPARARTADADVVNSDTYDADLKVLLFIYLFLLVTRAGEEATQLKQ